MRRLDTRNGEEVDGEDSYTEVAPITSIEKTKRL